MELEQEDSIEIDGHPDFSRQYRLTGRDREATKRLLNTVVRESLLQLQRIVASDLSQEPTNRAQRDRKVFDPLRPT